MDDSNAGFAIPTCKEPDGSKGIMGAFIILYNIYAVVAFFIMVALFLMIMSDMLTFLGREISQKLMIYSNPNVFNKDTMDFAILHYAKNDRENEPYLIYRRQETLSAMFYLSTAALTTFVSQICIYLFLTTMNAIDQIDFKEDLYGSIKASVVPLSIVFITAVTAFILNAYYNDTFIKKVQPGMIGITGNMDNVSTIIYDNITTDEKFLMYLIDENINECVKMINAQGTNYEKVGSMIFTMSLYNYFKINVSSNDTVFNEIREIFTIKQLRLREIKLIDYMYFNQNLFVPNLYSILEPHISGSGNILNIQTKRDAVRKNVGSRIRNVNKTLTTLFALPIAREKMRSYMGYETLTIVVMIIILTFISRGYITNAYGSSNTGSIFERIKTGFANIKARASTMLTRGKEEMGI